MSYKGTVIRLKPEANAPESFWDKAIADLKANVYGIAFTVDGMLFTQSCKGPPTTKVLAELREEYTSEMLVYLGNHPEDGNKDDIQPWVCLKEDDETVETVAMMTDGDFSKYKHEDQQRSDEYYWFENVGLPVVSQLYELLDGNTAKVMAKMQARPQQNAFLDSMLTGGNIFLLAHTGEIIHYQKNSQGRDFEWGYTTNTHGHIEDGASGEEEVEIVEEKVLSPAELMRKKLAAKMAEAKKDYLPFAPDKPTAVKQTDLKVVEKKEDPKASAAKATRTDLVEVKVPHNQKGWSNEKIKGFLNALLGHVPTGWKNMSTILVPKDKWDKYSNKKTDTLKDLKELGPAITEPQITKDTSIKNIPPDTVQTASKGPITTDKPTIPQKQLQDFDQKFLASTEMKAIRSQNLGLISPDELQRLEAKCPNLADLINGKLSIEESFRIDRAGRKILIRDYPDVAQALWEAHLIGAIKNHLRHAAEAEDEIEIVERKSA